MALYAAFEPKGNTFLVANAAGGVKVTTYDGVGFQRYRIRNLSATPQYFTWAATSAALPGAVSDPALNVPARAIGMMGGSVECFSFDANAWFLADNATGFEITAGEGV
jgi:hypothetical protein